MSFTDWRNFSTSTVTNPTITNPTGCLFRDYTSHLSMKLRPNFVFAEKVTQFSFIQCGLILCFSIDLRGVGASNISMLDCEIEALERMIWQALSDKEIEHVIDLLNMYGDKQHAHPYVYYCAVRELERITGENYIELVLPVGI